MTTPETPHEPSSEANSNPAQAPAPATAEPSAQPVAQPEAAPPPAPARAAHEDEDGPQPGNVAAPPPPSDEEEEGPAPGNERFPTAHADKPQGPPGAPGAGQGTGKKRRRRRKKHGAGHAPGEGAEAKAGEGGETQAEGEHASDADGNKAGGEGAHGMKKHKKDRPPRPERERPAFNVGDVTFGKITDITDEAIFVDLMGKANAIFDLKELLLPPDDDESPGEAEKLEAEADATAAAAKAEQGEAPAEEASANAQVDAQHALAHEGEAHDDVHAPVHDEAQAQAPEQAPAEEPKAEETAAAAPAAPAEEEKKSEDPKLPQVVLEVGAQFVGVVHNDGGRGGLVVLTHHPKRVSKAKPKVAQALKDKTMVQGLVTGTIKGGVEVDVDGLRAFVPGSHMDLRLGADLSPFVGKRLDFFVTQYGKRGRDVVLSRKSLLEEQAKKLREEALRTLSVGATVEGTVRSVVPFGAFIDIGNIEGLVPLQEMSHNRADGPSDVFKPGDKVQVKILKVDDKGKVWLSRKATIPDPWGEVAKKYAVGSKHTGKVVRIQPFGAFVELESGIDGLIHTIDLVMPEKGTAGMKRLESPNDLLKVGDTIEVVVANVDAGGHRIGLHPALVGEQASEAPQKVVLHKPVKALVMIPDTGGLLVRLIGVTGRNARGFVGASATGTPRGTELRKSFPVGTIVDAKVMELDPKRGEVKLSIRALNEESERNAYQQYRQQVKTAAKFTFGDLLAKKQQQK